MMLLRRLADPFQTFGLGAGAVYMADRILRRLSGRLALYAYDLVAQPIDARALLPERRAAEFTHRVLPPGDPDLALVPAPGEVVAARFAQGATCAAVYQRDKPVGYLWFCTGQYAEDEVRCTFVLPAGGACVFDFDVYVLPERRMGTAFVGLWSAANAFLRAEGRRWTYSRISRFNESSRRAHARLGAVRVGRMLVLRLGGGELLLATVAPYVAFSTGGAGPRLRLPLPAEHG